MDPVRNAPGIIGWFPVLAILLALPAVVLIPTIRRRIEEDEADAGLNLLPFALLLVAAILATASAVIDTVVDARAGLRELTTAALAVMCATPVTGAIVTRWRWGSPGSRTFHQQIAANRVGSVVLTVVLVEVLALTGYVIGASVGALFGVAMATGVVLAAVSVALAGLAAVVAARRGPDLVLGLVRARPLDADQVVRNVVAELSLAANIRPPRLYVIDDPMVNAFSVGIHPNDAAIALTTGLLEQLDREELQGVVAHEIAHIRNLDSRHGVLVAICVGAVVLLADGFFHSLTSGGIEINGGDGLGGIIAGILIAIAIAIFAFAVRFFATLAAKAVQASVSREREYLADATSVALTRNPDGLIRALTKVNGEMESMAQPNRGTQHLWFVNPLSPYSDEGSGWMSTHPTPNERIERLRRLGA